MSPTVAVDVRDSVAWMTLDNPPVNALSVALIDERFIPDEYQCIPKLSASSSACRLDQCS